MSISLAKKPSKRKQKNHKSKAVAPESFNPFDAKRAACNAFMIDPSGHKTSVNITPEAAAVWTRYGFKVEFMPVTVKVPA